jgi:hypothetical protein
MPLAMGENATGILDFRKMVAAGEHADGRDTRASSTRFCPRMTYHL